MSNVPPLATIFNPERRRFLRNSALLSLGLAVSGTVMPSIARAASTQIRIATNPGLENATLTALLHQQGFLRRFDADVRFVEAPGTRGPFDAIVAGEADLCMVSGYNGLLSRIEQGARVKIVGAGMRKTALTVFARPGEVRTLADLQGKTMAVGPSMGLLRVLMQQLLNDRSIDPGAVHFVDKGGNDECYQAVVNGEADACCASVSHLDDPCGLVVVRDANLWESLPRYTFQTAYAADSALRDKHQGIVAVMAAYGALYEYLMTPAAEGAFFDARRKADKSFDEQGAQAMWRFIQTQQPWSRDLSLTPDDIAYQQDMYMQQGILRHKQAYAAVADMSAAKAAAQWSG